MESGLARRSCRQAVAACNQISQVQAGRQIAHLVGYQPRRHFATPVTSTQPAFQAAPPIGSRVPFNQPEFGRPRNEGFTRRGGKEPQYTNHARIVPASPSYFTATPRYIDDLLYLSSLLRKYLLLPQVALADAPRVAWKTLPQYAVELGEPVRVKGFGMLLQLLKRLNCIHPSMMPPDVEEALTKYKRSVQPSADTAKPIKVDKFGRSKAVGRRKTSSAQVTVVPGTGECLVNGRSLTEYFARLHDRESAVWALKATERMDKYNVWALVKGGGTTGQADAITLGVARALLAHEPGLKPILRKGKTT